jgi:hypothetical protein
LPPRANAPPPWAAATGTYVDELIKKKADLFKAAMVNEKAMMAMIPNH